MKPVQIFNDLKDLAEKIGIRVSEKKLNKIGIPVKSGLCRVRGEYHIILDKDKSIKEKIDLMVAFLSEFPLDHIYILPQLRDLLVQSKSN